jgi:signal peptidase I
MAATGPERWVGRGFFALLSLVLIGRVWLFEVVSVANDAMAPALLPGELIWVWRGPLAAVEPGAVVLYEDSGVRGLKRVVASSGQQVEVTGGVLYIDGESMHRGSQGLDWPRGCEHETVTATVEQWGERRGAILPSGDAPMETVPDQHLYILGDHRSESSDSRQWGPLPSGSVEGVASRVVWSKDDCGALRWFRMGTRVR